MTKYWRSALCTLMALLTLAAVAPSAHSAPTSYNFGRFTGDFDGDGKPDLLTIGTNGDVYITLNGTITINKFVGYNTAGWKLTAIGRVNNDSRDDLVWTCMSASLCGSLSDRHVWFMNGTNNPSIASYGVVSADWTLLFIADFDGDGDGDFLWRRTDGATLWWKLSASGGYVDYVVIGGIPPSTYTFLGAGDFDGNGKFADLVWQYTSGSSKCYAITIVSTSGTTTSTGWPGCHGPDYAAERLTGGQGYLPRRYTDLDRNGRSDLPFVHVASGSYGYWSMDSSAQNPSWVGVGQHKTWEMWVDFINVANGRNGYAFARLEQQPTVARRTDESSRRYVGAWDSTNKIGHTWHDVAGASGTPCANTAQVVADLLMGPGNNVFTYHPEFGRPGFGTDVYSFNQYGIVYRGFASFGADCSVSGVYTINPDNGQYLVAKTIKSWDLDAHMQHAYNFTFQAYSYAGDGSGGAVGSPASFTFYTHVSMPYGITGPLAVELFNDNDDGLGYSAVNWLTDNSRCAVMFVAGYSGECFRPNSGAPEEGRGLFAFQTMGAAADLGAPIVETWIGLDPKIQGTNDFYYNGDLSWIPD